jgi:CRISPR/Cas system-associated exonuclease Cas4 (RecB family)
MHIFYEATSKKSQTVLELIDTYCRWRKKNEPPRGYAIFHPSAFGKCLRNMQYLKYSEKGIKGMVLPEEEFSGKQIRLFDKGNGMHARWAKYFEEIGILRGVWQCANPLCKLVGDDGVIKGISVPVVDTYKETSRIYGRDEKQGILKPKVCACGCRNFKYHEVSVASKELGMYGHADMILDFSALEKDKFDGIKATFDMTEFPTKPIVVDMKTCNNFAFSKLSTNGPDSAYQIQLVIYSNILDCEFGVLIYENKDNSEVAAFQINKSTDTAFAEVKKQAKTMLEMSKHNILPPPRPASKDCFECKKCQFRTLCHSSKIWDDDNLNKLRKEFYGILL